MRVGLRRRYSHSRVIQTVIRTALDFLREEAEELFNHRASGSEILVGQAFSYGATRAR